MSDIDRGAMMAQLRANRERLLADKNIILKLPGWDSLSVRYRRLPWDSIKALSGLGQGDSTQDIGAAMQVLIDACDEVLYDGDGLGIRYEQGLADLIGDPDAKTPAEVVDAVFPDEVALMTHAGDFMEWAMRLNAEASEALGNG